MIHHFSQSLRHERKQAAKADAFYTNVLSASEIIRFNTDSEADMEMQRQDVDLLLKINDITYRVSEKFRDVDYDDFYIEVYSKFPQKMGWMHNGKPNAILYFTPNSVYWITHKTLHTFCFELLFKSFPDKWFTLLYQSQKSIVSKSVTINDKSFTLNLIQAYNWEAFRWRTLGVSVPFWVLEENGVKFRKYSLLEESSANAASTGVIL